MKLEFDVDIDFADRTLALSGLTHAIATIDRDGKSEKHNTGVYFQDIPKNPFNRYANIDTKLANTLGYFKIDMLNVSVYQDIRDETHLIEMMKEPNWDMLRHEEIVKGLFHIGNYFKLVDNFRPSSVEELAIILALIRPAKQHLVDKSWEEIKKTVWLKPGDPHQYYFKKSHSIGYAMVIVVQMNLLEECASARPS